MLLLKNNFLRNLQPKPHFLTGVNKPSKLSLEKLSKRYLTTNEEGVKGHAPLTHAYHRKPVIGLALGSGSARGWAHIGVIRALERHGIHPDVVSGTSIGALVGGAYASGKLDLLEKFCKTINWRNYWELTDLSLLKMDVSGVIYGDKILNYMVNAAKGDIQIEQLPKPFAAVATDLRTGKEVWLQKGSLFKAIRCSIAIPGLFAPVPDTERSTKYQKEWLVDGALVNPIPVSLCRALGADIVIAVNLNRDVVVRSFPKKVRQKSFEKAVISSFLRPIPQTIQDTASSVSEYVSRATEYFSSSAKGVKERVKEENARNVEQNVHNNNNIHTKNGHNELIEEEDDHPPHMIKVITTAINIMQHRIVSSRMAGDPPEIELNPKLGTMDTFDFEKADFAIKCGENSVEQSIHHLKEIIQQYH